MHLACPPARRPPAYPPQRIGGLLCPSCPLYPQSCRCCCCCRSLEVVALLVGLFALAVGPFRHWRATVVALLALISPTLIGLTNE